MHRQAHHLGGFRRQGEKPGAEIQVEHALMRRADGGSRQAVERRVDVDRLGFVRRRLFFQQLGGIGTMQKRQHGDFFRGDHRQRQQDGARRRKTAGRRRAGEIFAKPADRHHRGGQRHQGKGAGAGSDNLRRLVAAAAAIDQIGRNPDGAQHDSDVGQQGGTRQAQIGCRGQRDQAPDGAVEVLFIFGPGVTHRDDGIGQLRARRQRQRREKGRQAKRPADAGGQVAVEHAGARQPAGQQHQQGDRHPARRGMADQHSKAAGDQRGGSDQRAHRGDENRQLAVVRGKRRFGPGADGRRAIGGADADGKAHGGNRRHDHAPGAAAVSGSGFHHRAGIRTGHRQDCRPGAARQQGECGARRLARQQHAGGRTHRVIGDLHDVPAGAVILGAARRLVGRQRRFQFQHIVGLAEIDLRRLIGLRRLGLGGRRGSKRRRRRQKRDAGKHNAAKFVHESCVAGRANLAALLP